MRSMLWAGAASLVLLAGAASAQDLLFPIGEEGDRFDWQGFEDFSKAHQMQGQTLSIFGPWRGDDQTLVVNMLAYFSKATGIKVNYSSSENYEQQIVIDTEAGSPPDIAILPQPGLIADLARKGRLIPLGDASRDWVAQNYAAGEDWVKLGTYAGQDGTDAFYALPYKADLKSLVWYSPDNFEDAGYEVPETMEELKALTEQIVADGATPWCIGLGSGGATGWPATDWVEDMMLRTQTPEVYDQWTTNAIPFNDPKVVEAIDEFGWFAKNDKFVQGGVAAVGSTDFRESPNGLFSSPPGCYLHRQASFISTFFPEGTEVGLDADFFYMPAYADKDLGKPVLGAGTLVMMTRDTEPGRAFIEWLKTPIAHEVWMAQSGFLTPFKSANPAAYANDQMRAQGKILTDATTFRFDGSDLMPAAIGAGSFWRGMVDYVGGKDAETVATDIQKSWDAIK